MKKPSLRFRQVFEHPTHFKVTRPLGNPIKIAKQGLSPNLMGRLRKFAEGGEVTDPALENIKTAIKEEESKDNPNQDYLRSLRDFESMRQQEPEVKQTAIQPIISPIMDEESVPPTGVPFDVVSEKSVAQTPIEKLPVVAPERVTAQPVVTAAPRVSAGSLMGPPAPVAPVMQSDVAKPKLDTVSDLQQMLAEEKAKPNPDADMVAQLEGALSEQGKPAATPVATTIAAPATSKQAGMVGKPAEAEPAKPVEPVKVDPLDEALGALNLTRESLKTMTPLQQSAALSSAQMIMAGKAATQAQMVAADANIQALNEQSDAEKTALKEMERRAREARDTQRKILEEAEYLKNPGNYFSRLSTLGQIGTAISLAAGAFATGMTGMPNFAQKIFDSAIEEDLAEQKRRSDSLYQRLVAAGHSVEGAEDMVRAQLKLVGAAEQGRKAAAIKLPEAKAKLLEQQAKTVNDAIQTMVRVNKEERLAAVAAEKAPLQKRKLQAEVAIAEGTPARLKKEMDLRIEDAERKREEDKQKREDRIAAAKTKADEERINRELTLGDVNLELKDDARAPLIREGISQRAQALQSLLKLEALLSKAKDGYDLWRPGSNTRNEAIAELNLAIENFPKGAGFGRAISVAAKELISKAIQDPTSYKSLFKEIFVDKDPAIGIKTLRQEVARNFEEQIVSQSRNTRPEIRAALESWYKNADEMIKRYKTETTADEEL